AGVKIIKIYSLKRWSLMRKNLDIKILKGDNSSLFTKNKEKKLDTKNKVENEDDFYQDNEAILFDDIKFAKRVSEDSLLTFVEITNAKILNKHLKLLKKNDIIKYRALPIQQSKKSISLAIFDPTIVKLQKNLEILLNYQVEFVLTNITSWAKIYNSVKESVDDVLDNIEEVRVDTDSVDIAEKDIGEDVIKYVNKILAEAYIKKSSDIHVEPYKDIFRIRFRIDGKLREYEKPSLKLMLPIISRIKLMAEIDIAEKRKPQDGRIKLSMGGNVIDFRVSSLPTLFGEKVVLRLLDTSSCKLDMNEIGMDNTQLKILKTGIVNPTGICLITGPTGAGKTTTLYAALTELNKIDRNLSTVEDPVEFSLEGINQVNVNKEAGMTFALALKAFLRQDPDVIMVGEIRDIEVVEIAIEAALTGHMVLSTLHTNDTSGTITRLLNMGVEPFLIVAALNVIVAQRLCRKICDQCKVVDDIPVKELVGSGIALSSAKKIKVYKGQGCEKCDGTGTRGRVAIYEVMEVTPEIKKMILKGMSSDEIK
ncbi:MAG: ATPase, T2SS/T4P/T4SS family, partial [Halobacteriovoraceae bacterium]|nr:ATPase, T2SS/T4P/T4SS family [Halobacteriovoraceae bacterium]